MNKYAGWIVAIIIGFIIILSCFLSKKDDEIDEVELMEGKHNVVINVKNYGEIALELDADFFLDMYQYCIFDDFAITLPLQQQILQRLEPS